MADQPSRRKRGRPPHPDILTPREWQVLDLIRQDLTNEQIAHRLDISPATAKYHVAEILSKLAVTTREEAAAWQPEAIAVRWWQRASAWVPSRAWPLAGAAGALAAVAALAWIILGASAGENDNIVQSQPSTSPSAPRFTAATPTPIDVVFAPLSITDPAATKLLFTRGQTGFYEPGALWMSNLDGSDQEPLIEESAVSDVIRVVRHWQTGNPAVYYTLREGLSALAPYPQYGRQTVSTLDLVTGERAELMAFEIEGNQIGGAADVTSDGRYIAYTDAQGLAIFDTSSDQVRRVLDSNVEPCLSQRGETLEGCSTFLRPSWSPDDRLFAMNRVSGDSSEVLIVDASGDPPVVTIVGYDGLYPFEWSPSENALCAVSPGAYYPVGLIVARAPDWRPSAFLTDYQSGLLRTPHLPDPNAGDRGMWGCVWHDESRVAVIHDVFIEPSTRPKEILVLDLETSEVRSLREHNEFTSSRSILPVPGRDLLISQFHHFTEYRDPIGDMTTPEVVDAETGARAPILTTQDLVVAAVPAQLLAR